MPAGNTLRNIAMRCAFGFTTTGCCAACSSGCCAMTVIFWGGDTKILTIAHGRPL